MTRLLVNGEEKRVQAVVFDMDNTFFDLVGAKMDACRKVTEHVGINDGGELFDYFLRDGAGFEDVECIADYLRDREIFEEGLFRDCRSIYETEKLENLELYGGVRETLEKLRSSGLRLAVVSDASRENVETRLGHTGLEKFFHTTVSRDRTGRTKPEPDSIAMALKDLEVDPEKAVMVGDSLGRDIAPARKLGMITVHAEYGDRNFEDGNGSVPDFSLEDIKDLIGLLNLTGN